MVEALRLQWGAPRTQLLLLGLGLEAYDSVPPKTMVPQAEVVALHQCVYGMVEVQEVKAIAQEAGKRTGDYLLANRIPAAVQWVLKRLPDKLAARVLCKAIAKHAWTFAGSGVFSYAWSPGLVFCIQGSPLCAGIQSAVPVCDYYAATFERIFRAIVNDDWRVVEQSCQATGAPACIFVFQRAAG
ncbi:MAG: bacteriochlorophyll 4-vinyl reductase [Rhodoferax sp.]|nr:bacteriochlorophyll 4-vinyl reductase [Rhodoferax sp.]